MPEMAIIGSGLASEQAAIRSKPKGSVSKTCARVLLGLQFSAGSWGIMAPWQTVALAALTAFVYPFPSSAQCGFAIEPAAEVHWYREQGWLPPGLDDAKLIGPLHVTINGLPKVWPEGITVSLVMHDEGYRVQFPEAVFEDNGARKRMLLRSFDLRQMVRWEMRGTPYAYSYDLWPLDVACSATIDIIDDRGDGKFRLMTSPGHTIMGRDLAPPPVPEWLNKPKS
jgi:hypothetical protein